MTNDRSEREHGRAEEAEQAVKRLHRDDDRVADFAEHARVAHRASADELPERIGVPEEKIVLGGFSQGCVMAYAMALAANRTPPAALFWVRRSPHPRS